MRKFWSIGAVVMLVTLPGACGGGVEPGDICENEGDCSGDAECMQTAQGTGSCEGILQPKLCTRPCTSDADCDDLGLACNRQSACGVHVDRCGVR